MRVPALLCLAVLSACVSPPPPPPLSRAIVAAPAAEVRGRLESELRSMGVGSTVTPGGLSLSSRAAPKAWAACRLKLIQDRSGPAPRADWAEPEGLNADVTIGIRPTDGGTEVTVIPRYAASYLDIFRNLPVNGACPSSGVLEQRLLAAAQG